MEDYIDAQILYPINKNAIIRYVDGKTERKGFLPFANMNENLKRISLKGDLRNIYVAVRLVNESLSPDKHPIFTQRKYFSPDKEYDFIVKEELENHLVLSCDDMCEYTVAKIAWEKGPEYKPFIEGSTIKCRVTEDEYCNPILERLYVDNPYFKEIHTIVSNEEVIQKTFNKWRKEVADESSFSEMDRKIKLFDDYDNDNAYWIFTYIKLLEDYVDDNINRCNYNNTISIIGTILELEKWIIASGFLLTFNPENRKLADYKAKNSIIEWGHALSTIKIIISNDFEDFLIDFHKELLTKKSFKELDNSVAITAKILKYSPLERIDYGIIEEILIILIRKKIIFKPMYPYTALRAQINSRRRIIRKTIFPRATFFNLTKFQSDQQLSHFIFLKLFEYLELHHNGDITTAKLEISSVLYYKALFITDQLKKIKHISIACNYLENLRFFRDSFVNQSEHIRWSHEKNLKLGRIYEYTAMLIQNRDDSISIYEKAIEKYRLANIRRGYLIQYYVDYLNFISLLSKTNDTNEAFRILKEEGEKLYNSTAPKLEYVYVFPQIQFFVKFYETIKYLGDYSIKAIDYIYLTMKEYKECQNDILDIAMLSKMVLTNNLIAEMEGKESLMIPKIREYLISGKQNVSIFDSIIEDEDENIEHEIFLEEGYNREYKSTFSLNLDKYIETGQQEKSEDVIETFLKSVVGMMNYEGGTIYIGVLELKKKYTRAKAQAFFNSQNCAQKVNRIIIGIKPEINFQGIDCDNLMLRISQTIRNRIKHPNICSFIQLVEDKIYDMQILSVIVKKHPSKTGIFLDGNRFFVRENNETIEKSMQDAINYLMSRNSESND